MANDNKKNDEKYPGYPHYPASEDITNPENGFREVPVDPNEMGPNARHNSVEQRADPLPAPKTDSDAPDPDADVSPEDREMLTATRGTDGLLRSTLGMLAAKRHGTNHTVGIYA